jgi:hypothetical protein
MLVFVYFLPSALPHCVPVIKLTAWHLIAALDAWATEACFVLFVWGPR